MAIPRRTEIKSLFKNKKNPNKTIESINKTTNHASAPKNNAIKVTGKKKSKTKNQKNNIEKQLREKLPKKNGGPVEFKEGDNVYIFPPCSEEIYGVMSSEEKDGYRLKGQVYKTSKMTKKEALEIVIKIQNNVRSVMSLCYELSVREGYKALGHNTFKECVMKDLAGVINYDYAHKMKNAGEVHRVVCPDIPMGKIPEGVLHLLHKYADDDRKKIWGSAITMGLDGVQVSATDIKYAIRNLGLEDRRENIKELHKDYKNLKLSDRLEKKLKTDVSEIFEEFRKQTSVNPAPPITKKYLDKSLIFILNKLRSSILDDYENKYGYDEEGA